MQYYIVIDKEEKTQTVSSVLHQEHLRNNLLLDLKTKSKLVMKKSTVRLQNSQ